MEVEAPLFPCTSLKAILLTCSGFGKIPTLAPLRLALHFKVVL